MTLHVKPDTDSACGNDERCDVDARVARGPGWELRLGRWQDVLADVDSVDAVITDPPYLGAYPISNDGAWKRQKPLSGKRRWVMKYEAADGESLCSVARWAIDRSMGWIVVFNDFPGAVCLFSEFHKAKRVVAEPLAWVKPGNMTPTRGIAHLPEKQTEYVVVTRPARFSCGAHVLPGAYVGGSLRNANRSPVIGGKPLDLMRAIVRDYSRPGDLIADPCAGGATTLLAAVLEGRRAIGAEVDPATFALAVKRLQAYRGVFVDQPHGIARAPRARQQTLGFDDGGDDGAGNGGEVA